MNKSRLYEFARDQRISPFVKWFVIVVFVFFVLLGLIGALGGDWELVSGVGVVLLLIGPCVLMVCYPGRYLMRPPPDGGSYFSVWTFRQFLKDYPGWDGKLVLGLIIGLLMLNFLSALHQFFFN